MHNCFLLSFNQKFPLHAIGHFIDFYLVPSTAQLTLIKRIKEAPPPQPLPAFPVYQYTQMIQPHTCWQPWFRLGEASHPGAGMPERGWPPRLSISGSRKAPGHTLVTGYLPLFPEERYVQLDGITLPLRGKVESHVYLEFLSSSRVLKGQKGSEEGGRGGECHIVVGCLRGKATS